MKDKYINNLENKYEQLMKEDINICQQIKEYCKNKIYLIVKNIYKNYNSCTGINYKNRKCIISDVSSFNGRIIAKPKIINLKTKQFTLNNCGYYELDYFEEIEKEIVND
jgi:hypothetical protein